MADNATQVSMSVAHHAGIPFVVSNPKPFRNGVQKQSRAGGRNMPADIRELLKELYRPHNELLLRLLDRNDFNFDKDAIQAEFNYT